MHSVPTSPHLESSDKRLTTCDLVVVGELNVDLILHDVSALPELGKERLADGMTLTLGSSSAILASNASRLGLSVAFAGRIGEDLFGAYVREQLTARRVDVTHVIGSANLVTGLTAIFTHGARRGMLTYPGAMSSLALNDIPDTLLRQGRHLHLSSYYLHTALRPDCAALFRRAKEFGLTTSLDTNWDPSEEWARDIYEVFPFVDVFLPNDEEACLIAGKSDLGEALAFLSDHVEIVVATCGSRGVRARRGSEEFACAAAPVDPVDAVGAGDSFNAGFLLKYIRGCSLDECLQYGSAAGAYSTTAAGGTSAFDDMEGFHGFAQKVLRVISPVPLGA